MLKRTNAQTLASKALRVSPAASFEHAKTRQRPQLFTNCGEARAEASPASRFKISRLMEFCSERELVNQTGHGAYEWPLVCAKELAGQRPRRRRGGRGRAGHLDRRSTEDKIVIEDNAGGIDADTIASVLDYTIRVSSREAYVSPTRGAQGNALKTILAMGYVLTREAGQCRRGGRGDDRRGAWARAPDRVPRRPRQQSAQDRPHHLAVSRSRPEPRLTIHWPPSAR